MTPVVNTSLFGTPFLSGFACKLVKHDKEAACTAPFPRNEPAETSRFLENSPSY